MGSDRFFVPRAAARHLKRVNGVGWKETTFTARGYNIPGVRLTGRTTRIQKLLASAGLHDECSGVADNLICRVYVNDGSALIDSMDFAGTATHFGLLQEMRTVLQGLATLACIDVELYFSRDCVAPYRKGDSFVCFVVGGYPPGETRRLERKYLCGVQLHPEGKDIVQTGCAKGYGILVKDDAGEIVAQIIDSTIYLFVPMEHPEFVVAPGGDLFVRAVRLAWNAYVENHEPMRAAEVVCASDYAECAKVWHETRLSTVDFVLELIQIREEEYLERLNDLYRQMRLQRLLRAGLMALHKQEDQEERFKSQFERLKANTLLKSVGYIDHGFQLETVPIMVEHDGSKRLLGSFGIRINQDGRVSIWALNSPHPKLKVHPHISSTGSICFGNYSAPIGLASAEENVAEMVELVTRWLAQGYDPGLADTPIEEWPEVAEAELQPKELAA